MGHASKVVLKKSVISGSAVILFERNMMEVALRKMLKKSGDLARLDDIVAALREAKSTGKQFMRFNRQGLRATLSRWLRTNVFPDFCMVKGRGVARCGNLPLDTHDVSAYTV